jgi:hypothetical protein
MDTCILAKVVSSDFTRASQVATLPIEDLKFRQRRSSTTHYRAGLCHGNIEEKQAVRVPIGRVERSPQRHGL